MSSGESANIFDSASEFIRTRLSSHKDVDKVIDHLKEQATATDHNPLTNRRLIIEPAMLSQRLRVPRATVEAVTDELRTLNLVHMWVRASCPAVDADDDNVIVETDNNLVFRDEISKLCSHCGNPHTDLGWENIDTFFAIHVDGERGTFDIGRLFRRRPSLTQDTEPDQGTKGSTPFRLITWVLDFFGRWARKPNNTTPSEVVAQQLAYNQPTVAVPTPNDLTVTCLYFIAAWALVTLAVFVVCRYCCDALTSAILLLILFSAGGFGAFMVQRALYAGSVVPRTILLTSSVVAGVMLAASRYDFSVTGTKWEPDNWSVGSGTIEPTLAICATVLILGSFLCVVLYHRIR